MLRLFSILVSVLACLTIFTSASEAETLVLANGDRLTGEVLNEGDGVIVFKSSVLGELRVPAENATIVRESATPAPFATTAALRTDVAKPARTVSSSPGRSVIHASGWKRQVEFGLSAVDGLREQSNVSLRLEAARSTTRGTTSLLVSHHYGKSDGYLVTDATSANALLTRNITDDLFVRGATRFDRDPVTGLDHNAEQSLGLGYTLLSRQSLQFSVGAGAAVRHRQTKRDAAGWNGLIDAFGRVKCSFTDRLSLSQDISVSAAPDDGDDYKLKSHTALVNKLTEILQMSLRYEFEHHGAANTSVSSRQRLVTAIGCVF